MGWKGNFVEEIEFRTIHETASRVMAMIKAISMAATDISL